MKRFFLIVALCCTVVTSCQANKRSHRPRHVGDASPSASSSSVAESSVGAAASASAGSSENLPSHEEDQKQTAAASKDDEAPKLTMSGCIMVTTDFANPNIKYYDGANPPSQISKKVNLASNDRANTDTSLLRCSAGQADVLFTIAGKKNGGTYGAKLDLYAMKGETNYDTAYVYYERDNFGTVQAGNNYGPEQTLLCDGRQLLGGATVVDSEVLENDINFAAGYVSPIEFISSIGYSEAATKVAYYSPKIQGYQAAISVTPDTKHQGRQAKDWHSGNSDVGNDPGVYSQGANDNEQPSGRNNIAFALTNNHDFNSDWSMKASIFYLMENTRPIDVYNYIGEITQATRGPRGGTTVPQPIKRKVKLRNARAWQLSGTLAYKDWSIAAGYLNNGKSRIPVASAYSYNTSVLGKDITLPVIPGGFLSNKDGDAGQIWNVGLQYKHEKWTFATAYLQSTRKVTKTEKSKGHILTFTVDYNICSGLRVFSEVDYADAVYNLTQGYYTAIKKQNAAVFIFGAAITF